MDEINKTILFNSLLSIYKDLLTSTQKDILTDYYDFNLSISEIAESRNTSRSAVEDAIKKGQKKLLDLEEKLSLNKKKTKIIKLLEKLKTAKEEEKQDIISTIERSI